MSVEEFNKHQQDVRTRTDSFTKAIFVLSGGALSISIGLFLSSKSQLSADLVFYLQFSWGLLATTILSLVVMLFLIIARDYRFGERWRLYLDGKLEGRPENHAPWDRVIWLLGIISLVSFVLGFGLLVYSAITFLEVAK
ncbi:hypothetical protein [Thiomicrospira sp. S5]|uniref:hypothetical protein n=1 Tax=Thiomicrospira sp. S5 TaxID=1803865 RepID=UPI0004A7024C|nr:hypothetical protein [Thiomicrospira sp. S5]AZR82802.1 hypothetical protein AYJ59_11255 [Thiomicrospira sp. S5]